MAHRARSSMVVRTGLARRIYGSCGGVSRGVLIELALQEVQHVPDGCDVANFLQLDRDVQTILNVNEHADQAQRIESKTGLQSGRFRQVRMGSGSRVL